MSNITLTDQQVKLLLSFAPKELAKDLPQGLDPSFYFTHRYESDLKICKDLAIIRKLI